VVAWKALAALAIAVGGAVTAFAVYTFGWHENGTQRKSSDPFVRTVTTDSYVHRVYRLRDGDVVLRPQAGTQCEASGEGGIRNLFCTHIESGRHQVIFYSDSVLVWPLDCRACGPDGPVHSYLWTPYLLRASPKSQRLGFLELRDRSRGVTYADAIRVFGKPSSCELVGNPLDARAIWRSLGIRLKLATLGGLPKGTTACTAPHLMFIDTAYVTGTQWQTPNGLKVGLPVSAVKSLYPHAIYQPRPDVDRPGPAYWIVHVRERCLVGVCGPRFQTAPRLTAYVRAGKVAGFFFPVGAQGE
jgi:hypothetical protein